MKELLVWIICLTSKKNRNIRRKLPSYRMLDSTSDSCVYTTNNNKNSHRSLPHRQSLISICRLSKQQFKLEGLLQLEKEKKGKLSQYWGLSGGVAGLCSSWPGTQYSLPACYTWGNISSLYILSLQRHFLILCFSCQTPSFHTQTYISFRYFIMLQLWILFNF